jgi:hypothetical protein
MVSSAPEHRSMSGGPHGDRPATSSPDEGTPWPEPADVAASHRPGSIEALDRAFGDRAGGPPSTTASAAAAEPPPPAVREWKVPADPFPVAATSAPSHDGPPAPATSGIERAAPQGTVAWSLDRHTAPFLEAPADGRPWHMAVQVGPGRAEDPGARGRRPSIRDPWPTLLEAGPELAEGAVLGLRLDRELERLARLQREQRAR